MDTRMNYSEHYGKFWNYNQRQWANLGIKFDKGGSSVNREFMLDCLETTSDTLWYVVLFIQIVLLKHEIADNNWVVTSGLKPELLYDRWTWKSTKIPQYIRDEAGELRPNVQKHPYTHLYNTFRMWMKQLIHEIYNKTGRYEQRSDTMYNHTVLLEPQKLNEWIDECSEDWVKQWVLIPDEMIDEDKEVNQEA